jgi:hypothetical protein
MPQHYICIFVYVYIKEYANTRKKSSLSSFAHAQCALKSHNFSFSLKQSKNTQRVKTLKTAMEAYKWVQNQPLSFYIFDLAIKKLCMLLLSMRFLKLFAKKNFKIMTKTESFKLFVAVPKSPIYRGFIV